MRSINFYCMRHRRHSWMPRLRQLLLPWEVRVHVLETATCIIVKLYSILDDEGAQRPHSFKSSSFSIPTQCGYCKVLFFFFHSITNFWLNETPLQITDIYLGFEQARKNLQVVWTLSSFEMWTKGKKAESLCVPPQVRLLLRLKIIGACWLSEIKWWNSPFQARKITITHDVSRYFLYCASCPVHSPYFSYPRTSLIYSAVAHLPIFRTIIGFTRVLQRIVPCSSCVIRLHRFLRVRSWCIGYAFIFFYFILFLIPFFFFWLRSCNWTTKLALEGATVHVVEPDDGSGWVKVADERGRDGLVPASYLEYDIALPTGRGISSQGGSGQYGNWDFHLLSEFRVWAHSVMLLVRTIYPYDAQGDDELSLKEGELIELTSGPTGGQHYGDGWWEGVCIIIIYYSFLPNTL